MTDSPDEDLVVDVARRAVMDLQADLAIATAMKAGQHLWTFQVTYQVPDAVLDRLEAQDRSSHEALSKDNVLGPPRLACLLCDVAYRPEFRGGRCVGPMELLVRSGRGSWSIDVVRRCGVCGCTDDHACIRDGTPCGWVTEDLCTACAR